MGISFGGGLGPFRARVGTRGASGGVGPVQVGGSYRRASRTASGAGPWVFGMVMVAVVLALIVAYWPIVVGIVLLTLAARARRQRSWRSDQRADGPRQDEATPPAPRRRATTHARGPVVAAPTQSSLRARLEAQRAHARPVDEGRAVPTYEPFVGVVPPVGEADPASVLDGLVAVVAVEGPVTADRLRRVYATAAGHSRVGPAIRRQLDEALDAAADAGRLMADRDAAETSYRLPEQPGVRVRALGPRTLHEVPLPELAVRLHTAAAGERGHRQVLAEMGVSRRTVAIAARLTTAETLGVPDPRS